MKKNLFFILVAVLSMASCAFAAEWLQIGEKSYLDVSSKSPYDYRLNFDNDKLYSVWKKSLNDGTNSWKDLEKTIGKKLWYNKALYVINCTKKEIGIKSVVYYDLKDNVAANHDSLSLDWHSVVPETNGELVYALVCNASDNIQNKVNNKIIETPTGVKIKVRSHK